MRKPIAALLFAVGLLLSVSRTWAGPVESELRSYRCLVPDWSKTSGGTSPALSPDGKTLVYLVHDPGDSLNDQVMVLFNVDQYNPGQIYSDMPTELPEPWRLQIDLPPVEKPYVHVQVTAESPGYRNVDWSPDGKSVAFIYNGRLFAAERSDLEARSAKARMLADVAILPRENAPQGMDPAEDLFAEAVLAPRWSPDGTRIAFLRPGGPGQTHRVCVLEVSAGIESALADNAQQGPEIWEQPWSPDGRFLVYGSTTPAPGGIVEAGGVSMAPVSGGARKKVINGPNVSSPSRSPKGDRLAFEGEFENKKIGGMPTIYISTSNGRNPAPVIRDVPSESQIAAVEAQMAQRLTRVLKEKYPGVFSSAHLKELIPGRISGSDVMGMLMIAEGITEAKVIGGEFRRRVERAVEHYPLSSKRKARQLGAAVDISKAVTALPKDKQNEFQKRLMKSVFETTRSPLALLRLAIDTAPVWSPDGRSLAFLRWYLESGKRQLMIADVATRKTRVVFEASQIESVSWTANGKSLLLVAKRNLAYQGIVSSEEMWPEALTMPSYPEIWVLDLK